MDKNPSNCRARFTAGSGYRKRAGTATILI